MSSDDAPFFTTMPCLVARIDGSSTIGESSVTLTVAASTAWNASGLMAPSSLAAGEPISGSSKRRNV